MSSSDVCDIAQDIIQHCMSISDRDDTDDSLEATTTTTSNSISTTSKGRNYTKYIHTVILSRAQ